MHVSIFKWNVNKPTTLLSELCIEREREQCLNGRLIRMSPDMSAIQRFLRQTLASAAWVVYGWSWNLKN